MSHISCSSLILSPSWHDRWWVGYSFRRQLLFLIKFSRNFLILTVGFLHQIFSSFLKKSINVFRLLFAFKKILFKWIINYSVEYFKIFVTSLWHIVSDKSICSSNLVFLNQKSSHQKFFSVFLETLFRSNKSSISKAGWWSSSERRLFILAKWDHKKTQDPT